MYYTSVWIQQSFVTTMEIEEKKQKIRLNQIYQKKSIVFKRFHYSFTKTIRVQSPILSKFRFLLKNTALKAINAVLNSEPVHSHLETFSAHEHFRSDMQHFFFPEIHTFSLYRFNFLELSFLNYGLFVFLHTANENVLVIAF